MIRIPDNVLKFASKTEDFYGAWIDYFNHITFPFHFILIFYAFTQINLYAVTLSLPIDTKVSPAYL